MTRLGNAQEIKITKLDVTFLHLWLTVNLHWGAHWLGNCPEPLEEDSESVSLRCCWCCWFCWPRFGGTSALILSKMWTAQADARPPPPSARDTSAMVGEPQHQLSLLTFWYPQFPMFVASSPLFVGQHDMLRPCSNLQPTIWAYSPLFRSQVYWSGSHRYQSN